MPRATRNILIQFRLRPDEHAALRAAAEAAGMSPGAYARRNALDHVALEAVAARLAEIAQRVAQAPTRDEIRDDLSRLGRAVAAAVKPSATVSNPARGTQS